LGFTGGIESLEVEWHCSLALDGLGTLVEAVVFVEELAGLLDVVSVVCRLESLEVVHFPRVFDHLLTFDLVAIHGVGRESVAVFGQLLEHLVVLGGHQDHVADAFVVEAEVERVAALALHVEAEAVLAVRD